MKKIWFLLICFYSSFSFGQDNHLAAFLNFNFGTVTECCKPKSLPDTSAYQHIKKVFERYLDISNYDPNLNYWDSIGITVVKLTKCRDSITMKTIWTSIQPYDIGKDTIILNKLNQIDKNIIKEGFCLIVPIQFVYNFIGPSGIVKMEALKNIKLFGNGSPLLDPPVNVEKYTIMH